MHSQTMVRPLVFFFALAVTTSFAFTMPGTRISSTSNGVRSMHVLRESEDDKNQRQDVEEDEYEDEDLITQRLRRSAALDPVKELISMQEDNKQEAGENSPSNSTTRSNATSVLLNNMMATAIHPDFDPAVSEDEAYVASQFEQLLSRKGDELSKLGPGIATLPLDPSSGEAEFEAIIAEKEASIEGLSEEAARYSVTGEVEMTPSLVDAQKNQVEVLEKANELQAELDQLHVDDCGAVLLANLAFYEAFSAKDDDWMQSCWWHSPSSICIHPSQPPLIGSTAILNSFKTAFRNGMKGVRGSATTGAEGIYVLPNNFRAFSVRGTTASLVCDEEIFSRSGDSSPGGIMVNKLLTTNVFRKINGNWKLCHRHASFHPETTAARAALKAEPGLLDEDESSKSKSNRQASGLTLKKMSGEGKSRRPTGGPGVPESLESLNTANILGIPSPKEEPKKAPGGDMSLSKIISLSDLLGGGDQDDNDDDPNDKDIGDALADMLLNAGDSGGATSSTTGKGTPDDPFVTRRIIRLSPGAFSSNLFISFTPGISLTSATPTCSISDGKIDDSLANQIKGGDDEKNAVIDLRGKSKEEQKELISQLVDMAAKDAAESVAEEAAANDSSPNDEESLQKRCINTLRNLEQHGMISQKQKRILLTDIIQATSEGRVSIIETAFDLLCDGEECELNSDDDETETGIADFTEQCRVFASEDYD